MAKKSKKATKKADVVDEPIQTRMQIIFANYLKAESLTLSQQNFIVSALSLSNRSLYDSVIIDIITDFLRYAKQLCLTFIQAEPIYYIIQNVLYKIMNDHNCNLLKLTDYFSAQLLLRTTQSSDETSEYISSEISQNILSFVHDRIFCQYELYRIALFDNNPSNIQYLHFKKSFDVGDIVSFQNTECPFKIQQFRPNDIVLNCLNENFKSLNAEQDTTECIQYIVSRDQLRFLSFVSHAQTEQTSDDKEIIEDKQDSNGALSDEIIEQQKQTEEIIKVMGKTLIDLIVDEKVQNKLESMQQKFEKQIEQYKQQIHQLKNPSTVNDESKAADSL